MCDISEIHLTYIIHPHLMGTGCYRLDIWNAVELTVVCTWGLVTYDCTPVLCVSSASALSQHVQTKSMQFSLSWSSTEYLIQVYCFAQSYLFSITIPHINQWELIDKQLYWNPDSLKSKSLFFKMLNFENHLLLIFTSLEDTCKAHEVKPEDYNKSL